MNESRKIIVSGCPGSGKSYFSRILSEITSIPVYHIDTIYWLPNWVSISREELRVKLNAIMEKDEWIIDGNYNATLEERFIRADLVYFLDLPTSVCLESEALRRGKKRDDLPSYLEEKEDPEFRKYIINFKDAGRLRILELIEKYKNKKVITFTNRDAVNEYLDSLKKSLY